MQVARMLILILGFASLILIQIFVYILVNKVD